LAGFNNRLQSDRFSAALRLQAGALDVFLSGWALWKINKRHKKENKNG